MTKSKESSFDLKAKAESFKDQVSEAVDKAQSQAKDVAEQGQDTAHKILRAQLGVYGKIADEVEARAEANRSKADELFKSLIARGEKVEADAKKLAEEQQKALDEHVKTLRAKFDEMKAKFSKKNAEKEKDQAAA